MRHLIAELHRRNVTRVAGLYLAGAWLLVQVAGTVLPMFAAPDWVARSLFILLAIGFLPVLVCAWVFEWTPKGLVRDDDALAGQAQSPSSDKRLDRLIMLVLALALGYFAVDKFLIAPARQAVRIEVARQEGRSDAIADRYGEKSVAVMPFRDMSQAKDQDYFSEGVAEQVLNLLTRVDALRVTSRASSFSFDTKTLSVPDIARKLNVTYVLDGSVRTANDQVRISVQLIEGRSDTQLWAKTFDRPMQDIFKVQDEIAAAVVEAMKVELLGEAPKVRKTDPEALRLYLQSLATYRKHTTAGYAEALRLAEQVLAIDPEHVDALNMVSVIYSSYAGLGVGAKEEAYAKAEQAALKALAIDPESADAHAELAEIDIIGTSDLAGAARHLQRALGFEPNNTYALGLAASLSKSLGRLEQAETILRHLIQRDPVMSNPHASLCLVYLGLKRPDEAMSECRTALALEPDRIVSHYAIAMALLQKGDAAQALVEAGKEPFEAFRWFAEAMAFHALGEHAKSDALLAKTIEKYGKDAAYNIAYVEAFRGNADSAFGWLAKAVEYQDSGLPEIVVEPLFAPLRADPRWSPLMRSMGKAPEQLAKIEFEPHLPK